MAKQGKTAKCYVKPVYQVGVHLWVIVILIIN